jgi:Siphovirus-type tail component, C-terminal domain
MTSRILRFVSNSKTYTFPYVLDYEDNFGDLKTQFTQLPAADGAYDDLGEARAPKGLGQIKLTAAYFAASDSEAAQMYDDLAKIISYGRGRLYLQAADSSLEERWCDVRIKSIPKQMNINAHDDYLRRLPLVFETDFPYWLSLGTYGSQWDAALWDEALWDSPVVQACSGLQTDFNLLRSGTAPVNPTLTIELGASESVTSFKIQRLVNAVVVDEVFYNTALAANDSLIIDAYTWEVTLNAGDAYDNNFSFLRTRWLELQPDETNNLRVILGAAGDACTVSINYFEAWN